MNVNIQNMLKVILKQKTKAFVARRLNCSRATVYRTLNGETEPTYCNGKAIEALYNEVIAEQQKVG